MNDSAINIKIRPYEPRDFTFASQLILEAFKAKVHHLIPLSDAEILELIKEIGYFSNNKYTNVYVAVVNDNVVGLLTLTFGKTAPRNYEVQHAQSKKHSPFYFIKKYGFKKTIRMLIGLLVLEQKVLLNECYIESLSVAASARGLGIGTRLVEFGESLIKDNLDFTHYSLHVVGSNDKAKALYERLGFRVVSTENSHLTQNLFGEKVIYYMQKIMV